MNDFDGIRGFFVRFIILCGIGTLSLFSTATSVSWTGPPYNIAILDGQTGTISCNGSRPLHWRSLRPTDKGLGNGNTDARSGYNISESPPGIYHLQFTGNVSSSPTIISCSEPGSGIEKKVYVIVFETPSCNVTLTGDATNVTCSTNFRGDRQYHPHFECGPINGSREIVRANDVGDAQTITATFSFPRDASNITVVCSVKFSKMGPDLDGTAVNTPEVPWSWKHVVPGQEIDDSKKNRSGDAWMISGIIFGTVFGLCLVGLLVIGALRAEDPKKRNTLKEGNDLRTMPDTCMSSALSKGGKVFKVKEPVAGKAHH